MANDCLGCILTRPDLVALQFDRLWRAKKFIKVLQLLASLSPQPQRPDSKKGPASPVPDN